MSAVDIVEDWVHVSFDETESFGSRQSTPAVVEELQLSPPPSPPLPLGEAFTACFQFWDVPYGLVTKPTLLSQFYEIGRGGADGWVQLEAFVRAQSDPTFACATVRGVTVGPIHWHRATAPRPSRAGPAWHEFRKAVTAGSRVFIFLGRSA